MSATQCAFCHHLSPLTATSCEKCNAPFHLAPCPSCNAVNNISAVSCYKCQTALVPRSVTITDDAPVSVAPTTTFVAAKADKLPDASGEKTIPDFIAATSAVASATPLVMRGELARAASNAKPADWAPAKTADVSRPVPPQLRTDRTPAMAAFVAITALGAGAAWYLLRPATLATTSASGQPSAQSASLPASPASSASTGADKPAVVVPPPIPTVVGTQSAERPVAVPTSAAAPAGAKVEGARPSATANVDANVQKIDRSLSRSRAARVAPLEGAAKPATSACTDAVAALGLCKK